MSEHGRQDVSADLAGAERAETAAQEQFVHGLLETVHRDGPGARERRIGALLAAMRGPARVEARRWRIRPWPVVSGLAAVIALAALVVLGWPAGGRSATAAIQASIAASKHAGDRRYEIRVVPPRKTEPEKDPVATLDVRDADHVLIRARTPWGERVTVGRNDAGAWAIRPDGAVDLFPPKHAWPRWVNVGDSTFLLVSVDELLEWLEQSYDLTRGAEATVPSGKGPRCERITAVHKPGPGPEPRRVELWIDRTSHLVRRMELHWDRPPGRPRNGPGGDRPPRDGPPGAEDRPPLGPGGLPPPPPRGRPRPPRGEGPRRGDGPPPPPGEGPPPDFGPDDRPPPPPEFLGEPPDFEGGRQPPPPRELIFELVDGAAFEDGWFDPETHRGVQRR
jgi:hypothetical protein